MHCFWKHQKKAKMYIDDNVLPEEYVDIVMQEFAYDPIKLSCAEDPSQVLYNRRTLETIWDTEHTALNPYTRQPFQICNVVPQTELKQQMCQYLRNNESVTLTLGLEVIPDYSQILNETEMKQLLKELVLAGNQFLRLLKRKKKKGRDHINKKPDENELKHWNALWKKLNLVRLYCQYRPENREVFSSINGYEYLFQVTNIDLVYACRHEYSGGFSCDEEKEVRKEMARIVDVMGGLKEKDLLMAREKSVLAFVRILFDLKHSGYMKIRSMVLKVYRGMFHECFYNLLRCKGFPFGYMVEFAFSVLSGWDSTRDVVNEDLYNGMTILLAAGASERLFFDLPPYVDVLCFVVTLCISRLQELHGALTAQTLTNSSGHQDAICSSTSCDDDDNGNVQKGLLSMALHSGLFLINSLLIPPQSEEELYRIGETKERLKSMDIVKQIVLMVKLVLADSKFFHSRHLLLGLKITELLHKEGNLSGMVRSELVRVLEDFLGSKYLDEYSTEVNQLVRNIVYIKVR